MKETRKLLAFVNFNPAILNTIFSNVKPFLTAVRERNFESKLWPSTTLKGQTMIFRKGRGGGGVGEGGLGYSLGMKLFRTYRLCTIFFQPFSFRFFPLQFPNTSSKRFWSPANRDQASSPDLSHHISRRSPDFCHAILEGKRVRNEEQERDYRVISQKASSFFCIFVFGFDS